METIQVLLAIINTKHGLVVLSARTATELQQAVYDYCVEWWVDEFENPMPEHFNAGISYKETAIELYFESTNREDGEFIEYITTEV